MQRLCNKHTVQKGFTLIELIVSMGLFVIVMIMASAAFNKIVTQASRTSKSEESNIEGVIGLEVMRHDLELMGAGLPWSWSRRDPAITGSLVNCGLTYLEATDATGLKLNDAANANNVPRAFVALNVGAFNSAYIAIKGATVGRDKAAQRWSYIPFGNYSATPRQSRPVTFASNNLQTGNMVLMVNSNPDNPTFDHTLIVEPNANPANPSTAFSVAFNTNNGISDNYLPTDANQTYMVYGLSNSNVPDPRMPFNRADFFIGQNLGGNTVPPFCAPNTGVLYKATVNHGSSTGGAYNYIPLLDCVADMQVVLGWDSGAHVLAKDSSVVGSSTIPAAYNGGVNAVSVSAGDVQNWLSDPKILREQLKLVTVYILVQDGKIDPNYTYPTDNGYIYYKVNDPFIGKDSGGAVGPAVKRYLLTPEQRKYHWKVYQIVVRPKNIVSNS